jgi:hypothetical protein
MGLLAAATGCGHLPNHGRENFASDKNLFIKLAFLEPNISMPTSYAMPTQDSAERVN